MSKITSSAGTRRKESVVVNPSSKSKKKSRKNRTHKSRKSRASNPRRRRRSSSSPKRSSRRRRKKNPGMIPGLGALTIGAIVGELASTGGAKIAGMAAAPDVHPKAHVAARSGGAAVVAIGGAVARKWLPNFGAGMFSAGVAATVRQPLEAFAEHEGKPTFLATLGFSPRALPLPDGGKVGVEAGVLTKTLPSGKKMTLLGFEPRQVVADVDYSDGSSNRETMMVLGEEPGGAGLIYMRPDGQLALLPGTSLGDIVQVNGVETFGDADGAEAVTTFGDIVQVNGEEDEDNFINGVETFGDEEGMEARDGD